MRAHLPFLTLSVAAAACVAHLVPGAGSQLEFDRIALARGEMWRWLTAHVTHFDANHLLWDVGVLLALGWYAEGREPGRFRIALLAAALAITPAVWLLQPQFTTYRGLSGLDTAAFGVIAGGLARAGCKGARLTGALAILVALTKCTVELTTGRTVFAEGALYAPVPLAHAIGFFLGLVAALWPTRRSTGVCNFRVTHCASERLSAAHTIRGDSSLGEPVLVLSRKGTESQPKVPAGSQPGPSQVPADGSEQRADYLEAYTLSHG